MTIRGPSNPLLERMFTDEQLKWLSSYGRELRLEARDYLFDERSSIDSFYAVLEGEIRISRLDGPEETTLGSHRPGGFTGQLAAMAGRRSIHRARALLPSRVLEITSEDFGEIVAANPEVAEVFISTLGRRMRETQRAFRQQEKLVALGKLSAGLAHELNNPASAARRAADELRGAILDAQLLALRHDERFSPYERERLAALQSELAGNGAIPLDPLVQSDQEDELLERLEDYGVEDAWDLASLLVTAGLDAERLEEGLAGELRGEALAGALGWLATTLNMYGLAEEVARSAERISELVRAVKEHTHMDRASRTEVDVREGLESTLTILGHKLKGVAIVREYEEDLPEVSAYPGELNQVWTNLIDNAADAVNGDGETRIKASREVDGVAVEITDDGPGIPREIQGRIFDPFFTTKDVGEGTGLGLDTVRRIVTRRHGGEISFTSKPGETRFRVWLPIEGPEGDGSAGGGV